MQERQDLNGADAELVEALGGLRPRRTTADRDRLLFEAGRAAGRRGRGSWQCLSGVLTLALCVSVGLHFLPQKAAVEMHPGVAREMEIDAGGLVSPGPDVGSAPYLRMRNDVLKKGLDALPQPELSSTNGDSEEWRRELPEYRVRRKLEPLRLELWKLFYKGDGT
jgi:hypothetical protein